MRTAKAGNALSFVERIIQTTPDHEGAVFNAVMIINIEVTFALEIEIKPGMPGERGQHMVEKSDSGIDIGKPAAVDIEPASDVGFFSCSGEFSYSFVHLSFSINCSVISGWPAAPAAVASFG
tara:strand:- start:1386 stop:1751 length:366 start_codon:yes stop_codon:yes gene_type:complete